MTLRAFCAGFAAATWVALLVEGCGTPGPGGDGGRDAACAMERCPVADAHADATSDIARDAADGDAAIPCGTGGSCPTGLVCDLATMRCVADRGPCASASDCHEDSHCVDGRCVPYHDDETNDACTRPTVPAFLAPGVLCSYTDTSPASDPFHGYTSVSPSLVVVDFGFVSSATGPHPSIVAPMHPGATWGSGNYKGVLRVLDGHDCSVQYTIDAHLVNAAASAAVGDLDGDGHAEIVASSMTDARVGDAVNGGLVAFHFDAATHAWQLLWRSHTSDGMPDGVEAGTWASPSIVDLDDDGVPEITMGGVVWDHAGLQLDAHLATSTHYSQGQFGITADVDNDARHIPEFVTGAGIWSWDVPTHAWVPATYFMPASPLPEGLVAIADFGDFPGTSPGDPEIAVISSGTARVQTRNGAVVFGPVAIPGGGTGGPPNIGDFNGDGHADFATAARSSYVVFDLQCAGATLPAGCLSNGIRWARSNQDASSRSTGSSVFDFNGDGAAEAIYADECFTRVYDGTDGTVVFSRYRPSCTWYETPVIADVNGDLKAEIVVPDDDDCGITCNSLAPAGYDSLFPGLRCATSADCPDATMACDSGLCRCTADAQCGDASYGCRAPDTGTAGTGNVCRALVGTRFGGVQVFGDPHGRWTPSRPVWNEHAYSITNVSDTGTIPASHLRTPNWRTPGLNNFRQNSQGSLSPTSAPELTTRGEPIGTCTVTGTTGSVALAVEICNRGTAPVGSGLPVAFETTGADGGALVACTAMTTTQLAPGACESVGCTWTSAPVGATPTVITVVPDPAHTTLQCLGSGDGTTLPPLTCSLPG